MAIFSNDLSRCHQNSHMAIVTAHVCEFRLRLIRNRLIIFRHWQGVQIRPESHQFARSTAIHRPCTHDIDKQSSLCTLSHFRFFDAKALKCITQQFDCYMLVKGTLRIRMYLLSQADHSIDITSIPVHLSSMLQVQLFEVSLSFSGKTGFYSR